MKRGILGSRTELGLIFRLAARVRRPQSRRRLFLLLLILTSNSPMNQKEKMKEDLLKIKALQKEISTDKKVKEGLKHEVVKLTKQMEKMQTVYGRLKATKFAPNANAQEFDKVRARKEREYDLEKEQQKNNNNNNNNNNNIEIVAETKLTKSTTSSKTALSEIDSNIVIN